MQRQDRSQSATRNFAVARERIQSRDVWHQRIAELGVLAEDLTTALQALQLTEFPLVNDDIDFYDEVRRFERLLIMRSLRQAGGSQAKAARLLRMSPTTLNSKMKSFKLGPWERR